MNGKYALGFRVLPDRGYQHDERERNGESIDDLGERNEAFQIHDFDLWEFRCAGVGDAAD